MKKLILIPIIILLFSVNAWAIGPATLMMFGCADNGELGDSSAESSYGSLTINYYYFSGWTPTTAGNVRYLRAKGSDLDGTGTACLTLWDSGGSPLGSCSVTYTTTARAWKHCDMGGTINLSGVSTYYISTSETSGNVQIVYGATAGHVDFDNWGAIDCGVDDGLTDDGDLGSKDPLLHSDNVDQDNP